MAEEVVTKVQTQASPDWMKGAVGDINESSPVQNDNNSQWLKQATDEIAQSTENLKKLGIPEINISVVDDKEIEELLIPVVRLANKRIEEKLAKEKSGIPLTATELQVMAKHQDLVNRATDAEGAWMTRDELNMQTSPTAEQVAVVEEKAKAFVKDAEAIISNMDLSEIKLPENDKKLFILRLELDQLATKVNKTWQELATKAGAGDKAINALKNAGIPVETEQ